MEKSAKALVIYAHPYEKSFCHAVKERVVKALEKTGKEYHLIDLYADFSKEATDRFDPILTAADLKLYPAGETNDPQVPRYLDLLKQTDLLIIVFPVWWGLMPAVLKGFFDKVLLPGQAYQRKKSGLLSPMLANIKKALIFNTLGGPTFYHKVILRFPLKQTVGSTTLKVVGVKRVKFVQFGSIKKSTPRQRAKWLAKTERLVSKTAAK